MEMLAKRRIISIDVSFGKYFDFVDTIINLARRKISSYVCVANVHMLVEASNSTSFKDVVNSADIVTPDGMPLAKSFKLLYNQCQERVDGMSLLPSLLERAEHERLSVYFYGGSQAMLDKTQEFLLSKHPRLILAGMYSPPFRPLSNEEKEQIVLNINSSRADLVFVVLGCPKQEKWMNEMKGRIKCVMIGIGGALPVLVGMQKRAPKWMQDNSLEWLYRLIQEPRRLFMRYLTTNSMFIYLLLKEKLGSSNA